MFSNKAVLVAVAAVGLAVKGAGQTPPAAPPAPPSPPRVLHGRSATTRVLTRHGYLGVGVADLSMERAKALKLADDSGVEVKRVDENSPASKAGLKEGDVIVEMNEKKVEDVESFVASVSESGPGAKVSLAVWRNAGKQVLSATLESRPAVVMSMNGGSPSGWLISPPTPPNAPPSVNDMWGALTGQAPKIGFEGESLTPQLAEFFGVKEGVLVRTVNEKTPASKAGLKAGDIIFKINGTPVSNTREISGMVRASRKNVTFTVMRNHKEMTLNVEVAEDRRPSPEREVL